MSAPASERQRGKSWARWDLGESALHAIARDTRHARGESPWRRARRRLRRNRPAVLCLVFLVGFGLLSLAAPLLPLPSPVAMDLSAGEARAPDWPWTSPTLVGEVEPGAELGVPGALPSRALGNLMNDGWRHQTMAHFRTSGSDVSGEELGELLRRISGRRPRVETRLGEAGYEHYLSLPLDRDDDLGRRLARATGESFASTEVQLVELRSEPGYWRLNAVDTALLEARAGLFGSWQTGNWMGRDENGRDILARIVWGSRTSILVALAATACSLVIGVVYGALAGLLGGRLDNLMMRLVDVLYSVPFIFLVIFLVSIIDEYRVELEQTYGIDRELCFFLVIGAVYWLTMARVVRGQVLSLKRSEFIEAARVLGASTTRILFAHLVPNVLSVVVVYLTLTIPAVMLFEAFLSFLGLGIEPPKVSWGLLAVDGIQAINPLRVEWWLVLFPALAMGSTLLALNVLGDGLRDALDPRTGGERAD